MRNCKSLLIAFFPAIFGFPLATRQCSQLADNFLNGDFSANWEQTSAPSAGTITALEGGSGLALTLAIDGPTGANIKSKQLFSPPMSFEFDIEASDVSGVISYVVLFTGEPASVEIDLELQGWSERAQQIMLPLWSAGHAEDSPLGLNNAPTGWPSNAGGPSASFGDFQATGSRYVVTSPTFSQWERATYTLNWTATSITWAVNGRTFAQYEIGSDSNLWVSQPLPIQIGIWSARPDQAFWTGPYAFNSAAPPVLKVHSVKASNC